MTEPNGRSGKLVVRVRRSHPDRWEEFHVERRPNANVISVLMQIQRSPVTADGKKTTPPAWDAACLEEVCGSCTMVINGTRRTEESPRPPPGTHAAWKKCGAPAQW